MIILMKGLSIEELYGGLTWLDVQLSIDEMKSLFTSLDTHGQRLSLFLSLSLALSYNPETNNPLYNNKPSI